MEIHACLASSLDGQIGPASTEQYVRISSKKDIEHLKTLRGSFQALIMGGKTFRAFPRLQTGHPENHTKQIPHNLILTRQPAQAFSKEIHPDWPIWQHPHCATHLHLLTTNQDEKTPQNAFRIQPISAHSTVADTLAYLSILNVERVLVEGGGDILRLFLEARALHTLHLTLCPVLIGQTGAPQLLPPSSTHSLFQKVALELCHLEQVGSELFTQYRIDYSVL